MTVIAPVRMIVAEPPAYAVFPNSPTDSRPGLQQAIDDAIAGGHGLFIPRGTYTISGGLVATGALEITGEAAESTRLVIAAGVRNPSVALWLRTNSTIDETTQKCIVRNLYLDAAEISGWTGIRLGPDSTSSDQVSGRFVLEDVQVMRFRGANAVGVDVRNAVDVRATGLYCGLCEIGLRLGAPGVPFVLPTIATFYKCSFRSSEQQGVFVGGGWAITFAECLFEANRAEGLRIQPAIEPGHIVPQISVENCWFEDNWFAVEGRATKFQFVADGSSDGTSNCFITLLLRGGFFSGSNRAIHLKNVQRTFLAGAYMENTNAPQMRVEGPLCTGVITAWPFPPGVPIAAHLEFVGGADPALWTIPRLQQIPRQPVANRADESPALDIDARPVQRFTEPLTANRSVTLPTAGVTNGDTIRVVRGASATGAFALTVGSLKSLDPGQWCDVTFDGSGWFLAASGNP